MLSAQNLTRIIDGKPVWDGIALELKAEEMVALRGPSGSGKTLLLRTLAGLDLPDAGEIVYCGRRLEEWDMPEFRRKVRYVPQDAAFPAGTVKQSIDLFFRFRIYQDLSVDSADLNRYLELLALPRSFLDKTADHLSGGEKQIVAIIRTLLLKPEVLLLDEPTSNLDEAMTERVEGLLFSWMESGQDHLLLWTSHDSAQLDRMTGRSIHMPDNSNH